MGIPVFVIVVCLFVAAGSEYPTAQRPRLESRDTIIATPIPDTNTLYPEKIIVSPQGQIYLLDTELDRILRFSRKTNRLLPINLHSINAKLNMTDVSIDQRGTFWVVDSSLGCTANWLSLKV
jgi:hypothetical protein